MNILLVVHQLWQGGGTETHVLTLASGLQRAGHRVVIFTSGGGWISYARKLGLAVHVEPSTQQRKGSSPVAFKQYLKSHSFDVIHAHDGISLEQVTRALAGQTLKPPIIFTVHGFYVSNRAIRLARKTTRAVVVVSQPIRRYVRSLGVPSKQVHTIANGVRMDVFHPRAKASLRKKLSIPAEDFVVGYAGRFTLDKVSLGKQICRTLQRFSSHHRNIHILVAGRNSRQHVVPSNRTHVLGHVSDMQSFYRSCDVVIGTARVAAESIACGTPTLAVGKGGYYGFVTPASASGLFATNFGDHAAAHKSWSSHRLLTDLSTALQSLPTLKKETALARAHILEHISSNRMISRILRLYRAVR